jgi:hypothetical protein
MAPLTFVAYPNPNAFNLNRFRLFTALNAGEEFSMASCPDSVLMPRGFFGFPLDS